MHRSKRAIKTPKRYDEEAFETPTKSHHTPKPQQAPIEAPVPTPIQPPPVKQVKLPPEPSPTSQPKSVIKVKLVMKAKETTPKPVKEPTPKPLKETPKPIKETPKPIKETPKPIKETPKPTKEAPKPVKETPKPVKELIIKKELTTLRPRIKREQTPPTFADLIPNVVLPFWDARTAAEDHEDDNVKELVHCHCGIAEELGLMVQCETCLTWQHAQCLGIERPEEAPDGYTCKACSDPRYARESMKWAYDQDWLTKGKMKQFPCDPNQIPGSDIRRLKQINKLIESVLYIHRLLHSLKVKSRILMKAHDDDPDLKLFRVQWPVNYQHRDGSTFIPTINQPSSTPASTISAIGDTPDPGDITVETVADVLPEIGQLDVSAILDNTYVPSQPAQQSMVVSQEATPSDCRSNLRLHIQQTEEFIGIELSSIEEELTALDKECAVSFRNNGKTSDWEPTLDSLKNDLLTMRRYISLKGSKSDEYD